MRSEWLLDMSRPLELHRSILQLGLLDTEIVKTEAEDCIDFLNFALSRTPGQVDFYYSLSHLYQLFGNDEEAHELMLKIHSFTPDCEVANYNLAVTHKAVGNIETALEHLSAIEHEDDAFMGKVMHSKAHCELMKLDFSKGWSSYEGAVEGYQFSKPRSSDQVSQMARESLERMFWFG